MKKIVFFDLDGTLLTTEKEVLKENYEAIKKARENDIEVCICTGRPISAARTYQEMSGTGRYIICANGAEIYDIEEEEELFAAALEEEVCIKLFEYATQNNLFMRIDTKYGRYINNAEYKILNDIVFDEDYKKFFKENKILQFSIGSLDSNIIDKIENAVNETGYMKVVSRFISSIIPVKLNVINIVNSSVSKGNAVNGLCKYLKIDLKDSIGFGDDYNDITMLNTVGYGVAMGNASEDVKKIAKEVISNNDEPGIAEFLNKLILENS